jgi:hypothetical protein
LIAGNFRHIQRDAPRAGDPLKRKDPQAEHHVCTTQVITESALERSENQRQAATGVVVASMQRIQFKQTT